MIKKIIIEIDKKEIIMSKEEAKRLYDDLHEFFGSEEKYTYQPYWYRPYHWLSVSLPYHNTVSSGSFTSNNNNLTKKDTVKLSSYTSG